MLAIWAITPNGAILAQKIAEGLPESEVFFSKSLEMRLSDAVAQIFGKYQGHIFIMSAGIVVRLIAPLIRHKTLDPAVVVVDDMGQHAISLLSGHIGGANVLTHRVAECIGAKPVITTATDVNQLPAIDMIAKEKGLFIENPEAIKHVNMAILTGKPINIHDPFGLIAPLPQPFPNTERGGGADGVGVFIDDIITNLPPQTLILRPASLIAGIGCNRNTDISEIKRLLSDVLQKFRLSLYSLAGIASIDLKKDEAGLIALADELKLPLYFFSKEELEKVKEIQTPSEMVKKHIGVKSVCEAAAILAAKTGKLIVPKHLTKNVTVAVVRKNVLFDN
jgi:cobalt-precorrin 5A hydrolase